jgi:hypothetical protein
MKLPNGDRAIVEITKLRDYCLSPDHPRGRHKARVFASATGLTAVNAEELEKLLLEAARTLEAEESDRDEFGQRYTIDLTVSGPTGTAPVRSTWIVRTGEDFPRLTSCYVL